MTLITALHPHFTLTCRAAFVAMAVTVEAKSLSALTALAANPPADPGFLSGGSIEPLTLYIARVPGSRGLSVQS